MADIPAGQPQPMAPIHGLVPASSTAPSASGLVPSHADPSTTRAQDVAIMDMDDPAVLSTEARSNTMTMTERTLVIHPGNPGGPSMSPTKDDLNTRSLLFAPIFLKPFKKVNYSCNVNKN